jgi:hypothetical protein
MAKDRVIAVFLLTLVASCCAQEREHGGGEKLGVVHMATSCDVAAQKEFDRAVALLHSFQFSRAAEGFCGAGGGRVVRDSAQRLEQSFRTGNERQEPVAGRADAMTWFGARFRGGATGRSGSGERVRDCTATDPRATVEDQRNLPGVASRNPAGGLGAWAALRWQTVSKRKRYGR